MTPEQEVDVDLEGLYRWLENRLEARGEGKLLGRGYQASVLWFSSPFGEVVVKKAHAKGVLGLFARRTLRHESEIYRRLEGAPGTVRCFGLLHGRYLVLEHIDGTSLRSLASPLADPDRFYARLLAALDAMHAAGIAHGDLKRKNNILVGPNEEPYVVDFGIAWQRPHGSPRWRRTLFRLVEQMDYNAWIKHKHGRPPYGPALPAEDLARYRPLLLERVARAIRIPWQTLTLRRLRKRLRKS
ncbi:MAG TPA: hypothetical protein VFY39_04365 [Gammaproteobacteria bacterium]|nr:hypothetical protein [Gammaproteobacteria bacterium]